jgi:hypothetical protein
MNKITERTDEILRMLKECLKNVEPVITFDKCYDPVGCIKTLNPTAFPLILVSYKGSLSNESKLYPGVCSFEIYFIDIKQEAEKLFGLMESVYDLFRCNNVQTRVAEKIITGHKLIYQDQNFHKESNEHVIYVQRYNLLIP